MSHYPVWAAGDLVTATKLREQAVNIVRATATQTITNSATPIDDTFLTAPLRANGSYLIEVSAAFTTTSATPDVQTNWSVPTGSTGRKFMRGPTTNSATSTSQSDTRIRSSITQLTNVCAYQINGAGTLRVVITEVGILVMGVEDGSFTFQWAQNASNATGVTREIGSYIKVSRFA